MNYGRRRQAEKENAEKKDVVNDKTTVNTADETEKHKRGRKPKN